LDPSAVAFVVLALARWHLLVLAVVHLLGKGSCAPEVFWQDHTIVQLPQHLEEAVVVTLLRYIELEFHLVDSSGLGVVYC